VHSWSFSCEKVSGRLVAVNTSNPRWDLFLPVVAAGVGGLMVALAFLSVYAFRQRDSRALDGKVFGLAHRAELDLRESGRDAPDEVLREILADGQPEIRGLVLADPDGTVLATMGSDAPELGSRKVDLFVGPGGRGGPWPLGPPGNRSPRLETERPRGRGRLILDFRLDPSSESPPPPPPNPRPQPVVDPLPIDPVPSPPGMINPPFLRCPRRRGLARSFRDARSPHG